MLRRTSCLADVPEAQSDHESGDGGQRRVHEVGDDAVPETG